MGKIKDLFTERESVYAEYSNDILKAIAKNVIPAVLEILDLSDNELEKLEWKTVQLQEDHVILNGIIGYKEGDVITDGKMTVTLDTAMALLLDKMIRVGIPLHLAETGSRSDIITHLREAQQQLREDYEAVYGHEPPTLDEAMEEALRRDLGMDFGPDFDYNDLTEEQKEALFISMTGSGSGDKLN